MLLKIKILWICKRSQNIWRSKDKIFTANPPNHEINKKDSPLKYVGYTVVRALRLPLTEKLLSLCQPLHSTQ